jgi:hypothetical protein
MPVSFQGIPTIQLHQCRCWPTCVAYCCTLPDALHGAEHTAAGKSQGHNSRSDSPRNPKDHFCTRLNTAQQCGLTSEALPTLSQEHTADTHCAGCTQTAAWFGSCQCWRVVGWGSASLTAATTPTAAPAVRYTCSQQAAARDNRLGSTCVAQEGLDACHNCNSDAECILTLLNQVQQQPVGGSRGATD